MFTKEEKKTIAEAAELLKRLEKPGDRYIVRGFGTFEVKHTKGRVGRNPQTGDPVEIPARDVLRFKASRK